jgi:hypothetical protein
MITRVDCRGHDAVTAITPCKLVGEKDITLEFDKK